MQRVLPIHLFYQLRCKRALVKKKEERRQVGFRGQVKQGEMGRQRKRLKIRGEGKEMWKKDGEEDVSE